VAPALPVGLEHVLILGMDYGLVLFTSDRGITPAAAARLADDHGFATFYVPEHTHIRAKREAAHPATGDETLPDDR
jgi:alkanesulfonate monooxygenase SsuD/methylene tetrahydromethanopterin reductase-like flavin-dependent oxidoreductase (luciferase family)